MANFRMSSIDEQLVSSPVGNPPAAGSNIFQTRLYALRKAGINLHKLVYGLARDTFVQVEPSFRLPTRKSFLHFFANKNFFLLEISNFDRSRSSLRQNSRSFSSISIALFIKLLSLFSSIPPPAARFNCLNI